MRVLLNLNPDRSDTPQKKPARKNCDYAVCWVHSVGKGRVFYTSLGHNSLGHNEDIYTNPLMLKHFLAGILFTVEDLIADTTPGAQLDVPNVGPADTK